MQRGLRSTVIRAPLIAAALLAGCTSPEHDKRPPEPVEVTGTVNSLSFPPQVGAYLRGKAYMFQPGKLNYSIDYGRFDADLQNAVRLFFYPRARRMDEQFGAEKLSVLRAHPGATLVGEKRTLLWKNGYSYEAFMATFQWEGMFADREQRISSQLILIALPDRSVMVWSSAPIAQAASAQASLLELLERIDWAY